MCDLSEPFLIILLFRDFKIEDGKAVIPLGITVQGDVLIIIYHARSTLGGRLQAKVRGRSRQPGLSFCEFSWRVLRPGVQRELPCVAQGRGDFSPKHPEFPILQEAVCMGRLLSYGFGAALPQTPRSCWSGGCCT